MKTWNDITHFAGFDWARDHHAVLVLDGTGKIVTEFWFDHIAAGWTLCQEKLSQFPQVAIAVAFDDPPAGLAVKRDNIPHGKLEAIYYDSKTVGTRRNRASFRFGNFVAKQ